MMGYVGREVEGRFVRDGRGCAVGRGCEGMGVGEKGSRI